MSRGPWILMTTLIVGLCLGWLSSTVAASRERNSNGTYPSYNVREEYEMSIGVDSLGNHRKMSPVSEVRSHVNVPSFYGDLTDVVSTPSGNVVLWYRDPQGTIRNAVLPAADKTLYRVQQMPVQRYEAKIE